MKAQQRMAIVRFIQVGVKKKPTDSPTWSVGEDNIALLLRPLNKGHTGVFLPVPHGLAEYSPLVA